MDDYSEDASGNRSDRPDGRADRHPGDEAARFTIRDDDEVTKPNKRGRFVKELLVIVGIVLALMFVFTQFLFRQYVVPSQSMEPTLQGCHGCTNDRIVVDKLTYRFSDPEPGDLIVFKGPTESWNATWSSPRSSNPVLHTVQDVLSWFALAPPDENDLVKRVIATEGQTVACRNDTGQGVTVDGEPLDEPYIDKSLQVDTSVRSGGVLGGGSCYGPDFGPVTVPENHVWVMGDNRSNSADSRAHIEDRFQGTVPESDIRGKVQLILYPFSRFGTIDSVNPQG